MTRILFIVLFLLALPLVAQETTPFPIPHSVKGLQVQMVDDALALGIHHAGINLNGYAARDCQDFGPAQRFR